MTCFNPTLVPKGTLKALAKRLGSHPTLANASTSQRQEIIARTFGHTNWYSLCRAERPATQTTAADPSQRVRLYQWLVECLAAGVDVVAATQWVAEAARKGGDTALSELAEALVNLMEKGRTVGEAFDDIIGLHAPIEAFVIDTGERGHGLHGAFREAHRMAKELANSENQGARA